MPAKPRSRATTRAQRDLIVVTASRMFREQGVARVSVPSIMAAVGATRGGFYWHFESKDALVLEACARAFEDHVARLRAITASSEDPQRDWSDFYLGDAHARDVGGGCPIAGFAGDVARAEPDAPLRTVYSAGVRDVIDAYVEVLPYGGACSREQCWASAVNHVARLVGAVVLARAVDTPFRDEVGRAVRDAAIS